MAAITTNQAIRVKRHKMRRKIVGWFTHGNRGKRTLIEQVAVKPSIGAIGTHQSLVMQTEKVGAVKDGIGQAIFSGHKVTREPRPAVIAH